MKDYSWPNALRGDDDGGRYKRLPRELVHAVGAVIISWSDLERTHLFLLKDLIGIPVLSSQIMSRIGDRILIPMGNRSRGDLFRGTLQELKLPPEEEATFLAFQAHVDICLGNRNLIAHASFNEEYTSAYAFSEKAVPRIGFRDIPISEPNIWEEIIEANQRTDAFGFRLIDFLGSTSPEPLPDIPPEPHNLLTTIPIQKE